METNLKRNAEKAEKACLTIPHHTIAYHAVIHPHVSYHAIPWNAILCNIMLYNSILYETIPFHAIQYHVIIHRHVPYAEPEANTIIWSVCRSAPQKKQTLNYNCGGEPAKSTGSLESYLLSANIHIMALVAFVTIMPILD